MSYKFETLEKGVAFPSRETFAQAFKDLFDYVKAAVSQGGYPLMLLETGIWIKGTGELPIFFYDARDKAIKDGLLVDGEWAGPTFTE